MRKCSNPLVFKQFPFCSDLEEEIIVLKKKGDCDISSLASKIPDDNARYHLFRFKHMYEGDSFNSNGKPDFTFNVYQNLCLTFEVFIYSMPGYSVSIKERMLYSSCKNSVVDAIEKIYSIPIDKKIEVDSGSELTEEFLMVLENLTNIKMSIHNHFLPREKFIQSRT